MPLSAQRPTPTRLHGGGAFSPGVHARISKHYLPSPIIPAACPPVPPWAATLDQPVLATTRGTAQLRQKRGTRTRLRRMDDTGQVPCDGKRTGDDGGPWLGDIRSKRDTEGDPRRAQRQLPVKRFLAGHVDVPDRWQLPRSDRTTPQARNGQCSDPATVRQEATRASGIRAHELLTLGRSDEQTLHDRRERSHLTRTAAKGMKYARRDGVIYTVVGGGGLVPELPLPHRLAGRLEQRRRPIPALVMDRGVYYRKRYDIGGGQDFSASFSRASMAVLGKSRRASAPLRLRPKEDRELMRHAEHCLALAVVPVEVGRLWPDITQPAPTQTIPP